MFFEDEIFKSVYYFLKVSIIIIIYLKAPMPRLLLSKRKGGGKMLELLVIFAVIASNGVYTAGAAYSWKRSSIGNPRMDLQKCRFAASDACASVFFSLQVKVLVA